MPKKIFIPKNETQQSQFLVKYPECDGRGLKMAILDGGIDVSLPGLQKTSTGLPKIIDCFECTGNGSVDTSAIKKVDENNSLIGLSGRELKIPLKRKNPSREWHLGFKSLIKLCQNERNKADFERECNYLFSNSKTSKNYQKDMKGSKEIDFIDCIVWNDGEKWLSSLITSANCDDLENVKVITNFRDEHDFCYLVGKITCCVSIKEEGNLLQILTSAASHGTKVAQVAVSHYPNDSEGSSDGLAPGAQIYFMDMSGVHDRNFAEKALPKCTELGVDLINISCGLRTRKMIEKLTKIQNEHGTIIVYSAGNEGPLYWTTKGKEELDDQFLIIGSLITPEMEERIHKWKSPNPPSPVLMSSKGPSYYYQSRGVSFVAPGEAIVPTTQWISDSPQFTNGTSIAAPNAACSIACLLSALKATSIPYSPALIKFALENTAIPLENKLASGAGIIQIDDAFEFLKSFSKMNLRIPFPKVFIKDSKMKGICEILIDFVSASENSNKVNKYCISLSTANAEENQIPWILKLSPESSNTYISHSKTVKNGTFDVEIMLKSLVRGKLYYAEIQGFHPSPTVTGSFFHLPITLVVPAIIDSFYKKYLNIRSNIPTYLFLESPPNAKKCIFQFILRPNIFLMEETIEIDSDEANRVGVFKFYDDCCDLAIRWEGTLFEACFYKQEKIDEIKACKFDMNFL